ncbi:hypothetical protein [Clostridiisalibacter paucivorans]|uniref:hypothetical protein n=1 Tax=Clostridiisalibacter paucivorans TaxID=408753 RepID=UPI00047D2128|nr:hypothetical protein [Clostridiisalibacter paucivorans]
MARISKSSSINKKRIHSSFVDRNRSIRRTEAVESVNSVNNVGNNTGYTFSSYLMASDQFYEKLEELRREYDKFYHHEVELEKAIKDIQENKDKLIDKMKKLIIKYNNAIDSLVDFDDKFNTNHAIRIKNIINDFSNELKDIGINIVEEKRLSIDENIFYRVMTDFDKDLMFLFEPIKGLIIRLYRAFKNIKVPFDEKENINSIDYRGFIMDKKY